jgi:DNA modification methylase
MNWQVIQGNTYSILNRLLMIPEERGKYRLIVTSPPYYQHRHYGVDPLEIGQEKNDEDYIEMLSKIFIMCKDLLSDDGSLWIIIGDTRRKYGKLMVPHRLALKLVKAGYTFREDIIWYKKNNVSSSSRDNLAQAYELILFLSRNERCFVNMDNIRIRGNEAREGRNKVPPTHLIQYKPSRQDKDKITKILNQIHHAHQRTRFEDLPSTSEISRAFGYDPEKYCPTCYRKFKRHATRKRIGDHRHYPIFAVCNSMGKNPGNVWDISTKAHYGNEHFAIFPEDLIAKIIGFATENQDWVLDPFMGRGTTGMVCAKLRRNFTGIDLYSENVSIARNNINKVLDGRLKLKIIEPEEIEST